VKYDKGDWGVEINAGTHTYKLMGKHAIEMVAWTCSCDTRQWDSQPPGLRCCGTVQWPADCLFREDLPHLAHYTRESGTDPLCSDRCNRGVLGLSEAEVSRGELSGAVFSEGPLYGIIRRNSPSNPPLAGEFNPGLVYPKILGKCFAPQLLPQHKFRLCILGGLALKFNLSAIPLHSCILQGHPVG
jgi:hypothetical protein